MGVSRHLFRGSVLGVLMMAMVAFSAAVATAAEVPDASCQVESTWSTGVLNALTPLGYMNWSSAQTFTAANSGSLTTVNLQLSDFNNTGSLVVQIRPVGTSGAPSTTALASTSISASQIPDRTYTNVSAHFGPGAEVVAGQQYAIFLYTSDGSFHASTNDTSSPSCPGMLYKSRDGGGSFSSSSSEDLIFSTFVEVRPVATNDDYSTAQDTPLRVAAPGLLSNDSDAAGDALTAVKVTDPAHGEVFVSADGSFSYFPDAGYAGADSFTYKASDGTLVSNSATVRMQVKDTTAPKVNRVVPAENATGVGPAANVSAFFSEAMRVGSINTNAIKLYKAGTTTPLAAAVSYDAATKKATLNPNANLQRGAKYKAVVSAGAKDVAGNALDQNPSVTGNQSKVWFFTVRN